METMKLKSMTLAVSLSLAAFFFQSATAAQILIPPGVTFQTEVEGMTEYKLANGLRVLFAPDAGKATTTVNVTYLVGSRHESYGETGMAHLLEHLVFKGTPSLPNGQLTQEMTRRGMQFNGTTWLDRTNYFETFPASDNNLDWVLKMEADRMVNSFIARKDLDTEMTVVRNEMESGENSPFRILSQRMRATAYLWHNYGKETIGARSDVENVSIDHLQAFYRKYYQPDNAVLVITGKFDPATALKAVHQYFGVIPKPTRVLTPTYTVEPPQDGPREVTLRRAGETPLLGSAYHVPAATHPDFAPLSLLMDILADTPTGRLHKTLVEGKLATGVSSYLVPTMEPGLAQFLVRLSNDQSPEAARKALLNGLESLASQPITEEELKRAKTISLNGYEQILNDPVSLGRIMSEAIALGDWRLFFLGRDQIEAVTLKDVQRVANTYFQPNNRTFGQFVPTQKSERVVVPAAPSAATLVAGYQGRAAVTAGESFDASPANIEKQTQRFKLANGLQAALLHKTTRGNTVNGTLLLHFGNEQALRNQKTTGEMVAGLLLRGAAGLTRQQIADRLDELKANVSITGDATGLSVTFQTRRDQLPALLTLLSDILRKPTFPETEFEQFRTAWRTNLDISRAQPDALARLALMRHGNSYPPDDIRYVKDFDEQLAAINSVKLADLTHFHQQFYGANHAEFSLVGEFEESKIRTILPKLFADWKSQTNYQRVAMPYLVKPATSMQIETPDKANANYLAALRFPLQDDAPDYVPLAIANQILGAGGMKSRLADRLRQKEGISYGAGSSLSASPFEPNGGLSLYAIYAPQNRQRLQQAVSEELDRILKEGVTQQELDEARNGLLEAAKIARTQDGALAGALASNMLLKRTMQFAIDREAALARVTVEQVNTVLRHYLQPAQFVHVYAGDFAGADKKAEAKP
ncbi:zinc protease [Chitinivorax tropicus]|uniref:Zinc protease n=1 Tax=Chitinivorax tropicus TaxID=714531 RepID=A0A840MV77_9PROT|nr:pitrilysin family protein [Chitinivorax tropicus]MBB5020233.1 zinc protease [Chitinivorax tropicus]